MPGSTKLVSVLYCVIIYKFHSVTTIAFGGKRLLLNPHIRLYLIYLILACLIADKDYLRFHKDNIHRLLSYSN